MIALPETGTLSRLVDLTVSQPAGLRRHARNVAGLSAALAGLYGCKQDQIARIHMGCLLHDIGKQFIAMDILEKDSLLTEAEFAQVQLHPSIGHKYLCRFLSDSTILNTVLYHHERWDGSGYPHRLERDGIPLGARICAVADVWDALVSNRCYRSAWSMPQALNLIRTNAGSMFDPKIVSLFLQLAGERVGETMPEDHQPGNGGVRTSRQSEPVRVAWSRTRPMTGR